MKLKGLGDKDLVLKESGTLRSLPLSKNSKYITEFL